MDSKFLKDILTIAVQNEISNLDLDYTALAEKHALKMLEQINVILDTNWDDDKKVNEILKIMVFCPVPPHIDNI